MTRPARSTRVSDSYFSFKEDDPSEDAIGSKLPVLSQKNDKHVERAVREMKVQLDGANHKKEANSHLKFKNSQTASEVFRIRRNKIV